MRARDLGITIGAGSHGQHNAITDVQGVTVGYCTLIEGADVRTGVTVVVPFGGQEPLFAGIHRLNGNGELTGTHYIREMGMLSSPIGITNSHSVGTVSQGLVAHSVRAGYVSAGYSSWSLPVVAETWDGVLNDINGFHVRPEHVDMALAAARGGTPAEGNVGGGTGMICHGFKGGTGTASRVLDEATGGYTVGALVQANHGARSRLTICGVPVGRSLPATEVPLPGRPDGSIIVVLATDAPLLPTQCERLAQRAALGIARVGGVGEDSSGDLILAFSTGNRNLQPGDASNAPLQVRMLPNPAMTPLFAATVEATEEAIVNALLAAETMTGKEGNTAYALPHDRLLDVLRKHSVQLTAT
ncbi:MAG TPA: P1 family peptidase [Chloroflexota bacterium]